ncbi:MAG TPA: TauD/TfdA family dioxygenase [Bacteroidia bacterium]|nr:TauD/TfdA family dioxygenase [Bacteroidia bacterium]
MREQIIESINTRGYWVSELNNSYNDFMEIISYIGEPLLENDIIIDNTKSTRLFSPKGMDFHTDHILANYIAWYCIKQSNSGGESLLIDSKSILNNLEIIDIKNLLRIKIRCPNVIKNGNSYYNLLTHNDTGEYMIYYAPWLIEELESPELLKSYNNFLKILHAPKLVTKILLSPGQFLIINNNRVMHGRGELPVNTNRHLKRIWISHKHE